MTSYTFSHYVILMMTLHGAMSVKTENTGAGVEIVKISANRDNLITKIFLAI